jgi:hypothetical protein
LGLKWKVLLGKDVFVKNEEDSWLFDVFCVAVEDTLTAEVSGMVVNGCVEAADIGGNVNCNCEDSDETSVAGGCGRATLTIAVLILSFWSFEH